MLACVAALWYDIMLTFATEVDRVGTQIRGLNFNGLLYV